MHSRALRLMSIMPTQSGGPASREKKLGSARLITQEMRGGVWEDGFLATGIPAPRIILLVCKAFWQKKCGYNLGFNITLPRSIDNCEDSLRVTHLIATLFTRILAKTHIPQYCARDLFQSWFALQRAVISAL